MAKGRRHRADENFAATGQGAAGLTSESNSGVRAGAAVPAAPDVVLRQFRTSLRDVAWPALPGVDAARLMALQYQFDVSQWRPAEILRRNQFAQARLLLDHAGAQVPFYRERLAAAGVAPGGPLDAAAWSRLPVLERKELQAAGAAVDAAKIPDGHGGVTETRSSGSTGMPVRVKKTALALLFWQAVTLRDYLWHRRDFLGKLCAVRDTEAILGLGEGHRAAYPHGINWKNWGGSAATVFRTGPSAALHIHTGIEEQIEWLQRQAPTVLITFPSNLRLLLRHCEEHATTLPSLVGLSTLGEVMTDDIRAAARRVWGVEVKDIYSSAEVGYIALQCPEHDHYHVQSETMLVEVLDAGGKPCGPGEVGRVVVTPLHNFATPLIRYAVGDYAEVGGPCACGRGLPVLNRVMGRTRNMLLLPSGRQVWPELEGGTFTDVAPVSQFQIVQTALERLEVKLVVERPMSVAEEDKLRALIRHHLGHPFEIEFSYHDAIPRSRAGKYEDFRSEIA